MLAIIDPDLRKAIHLLVVLAIIAVIVFMLTRIPMDAMLKQLLIVVAAVVMILIACDWYL